MYETLNDIQSDLRRNMLSEAERTHAIDQAADAVQSNFNWLSRCDAMYNATKQMGDAFEQAVKDGDEAQIGYWYLQIERHYAKELVDEDETVRERENETRKAS